MFGNVDLPYLKFFRCAWSALSQGIISRSAQSCFFSIKARRGIERKKNEDYTPPRSTNQK